MPTEKYDGWRKSDSGGGGGPGQAQRKAEAEKTREDDPQLRVREKFGELFNPTCHKGHLELMIPDGRDIFIQFHFKVECIRN